MAMRSWVRLGLSLLFWRGLIHHSCTNFLFSMGCGENGGRGGGQKAIRWISGLRLRLRRRRISVAFLLRSIVRLRGEMICNHWELILPCLIRRGGRDMGHPACSLVSRNRDRGHPATCLGSTPPRLWRSPAWFPRRLPAGMSRSSPVPPLRNPSRHVPASGPRLSLPFHRDEHARGRRP